MEERVIEIPMSEYQELVRAKARAEAVLIYIEADGFADKRTVKSMLKGEVIPCVTEESDQNPDK